MSQHKIKATELDFQDSGEQNLLFFYYFWPIFGPDDQIKHLNGLKHTVAHQFLSYVTLESH